MQNTIEVYQNRLIKNFKITYKRYLFKHIDFSHNLIGIIGTRMIGKTTMLIQRPLELQHSNSEDLFKPWDIHGGPPPPPNIN
ncbi:hypothetical protein [Helicobacter bilis]|uniref:hypothetical protein n=1 Tax=Helicobacter bilis TaxID=37372 RepID=UPI0026F2580E|nr:hypothetical protein [Helicobacter bilis]